VLRFILTGKTDGQIQDKDLARIVEKCTAFSPQDRYQSADAVKRALLSYGNRTKQKAARAVVSVLVVCAAIAVGFAIGRYTDVLSLPASTGEPFVFTEPLIEKAVRLMLGTPDDQSVTRSDLDGITELYIIGNAAVRTADELNDLAGEASGKFGSLSRLDDLREMKNLRLINFFGQSITDLLPLADCRMLTAIDLLFCPITDLSPLAVLPQLHQMNIMGTGVRDFSPLDSMASFRLLWISRDMEQYLNTMSRDDIQVTVN
jgi:hypothetical protein